ncbi:MAG: hypothetical protein LBR26_00135 [Prevotella sp.]|jgi:hypothetical protein|nr:hypothetical protein [Prevotella sp.]
MDELNINYKKISRSKKITNIVAGGYLTIFTLYFAVTEGFANRFGILFFCAILGLLTATILIFGNTIRLSGSILKINTNSIISSLPKQNKATIDWTTVSRVNIGMSHVVFLLNGEKKQKKIDLSALVYDDVRTVKAKLVEICEYKNIPYQND